MDNHFKEALELVKCQAAVRIMTAEEMTAMAPENTAAPAAAFTPAS